MSAEHNLSHGLPKAHPGKIDFDTRWLSLISRVLVGLTFGMAGYYKVFELGAMQHAEGLFVEPYADSWIPVFLLWSLGLAIPYLELIGGWLLVVGWQRRWVAVGFGLLLMIVTYGHLLVEPFYHLGDHVQPRLMLLIPTLMLGTKHDPWSVDGWLARQSLAGGRAGGLD